MEILRLNYELEYMKAMLSALMESSMFKVPDLDAGKWYKKPNRPDIPNN